MSLANNHSILGRLGKDPELNYLSNGQACCKFSVCCNDSYRDKAGNKVERVSWHNVTAFRHAETIKKYFSKGSVIHLNGPSRTTSYDSKDGIKKYVTFIELHNFNFVPSKITSEKAPSADQQDKDEAYLNQPDDFPTHTLGYEMTMDTSFTVDDLPF